MADEIVQSPCVNVCVLGLDKICAGCYRSLEEISAWSDASNSERRQIIRDARQRQEMDSNARA
ncbi:MAG: DUF1289 domain-containing protein [Gammaproteobacteria bacterium]